MILIKTDESSTYSDMRPSVFKLAKEEAAMVAQAAALLDWHDRYVSPPPSLRHV